jgi:pyruvate-ferredoxin/flavodoxin oxidoreductase
LCVEVCPIRDKTNVSRKALNMAEQAPLRKPEAENWEFFLKLPDYDRRLAKRGTLPGSMLLQPYFEFSGACVGCGETPYIRLATQLFGDRMMVANATGCSSIYGGNLPTTPYTTDSAGRGPAWNNSLFEDNAEFGLGMRLATNQLADAARTQLRGLALEVGDDVRSVPCSMPTRRLKPAFTSSANGLRPCWPNSAISRRQKLLHWRRLPKP